VTISVEMFMAQSLDGAVARRSGSEDFLSKFSWENFCALVRDSGCFILGRKTYEAVLAWPDFGFDDIQGVTGIIVSRNANLNLRPGMHRAESPEAALQLAAEQGHDRIILSGGSLLNSEFLRRGLVRELRVNVEPLLVGDGLRLADALSNDIKLQLIESRSLEAGIVQLRYSVAAEQTPRAEG
jgi:dihydrofolate reductase